MKRTAPPAACLLTRPVPATAFANDSPGVPASVMYACAASVSSGRDMRYPCTLSHNSLVKVSDIAVNGVPSGRTRREQEDTQRRSTANICAPI